MTIKRMDNVLIVVDDLEAVKAFFIELGLRLEGESTVDRVSMASGTDQQAGSMCGRWSAQRTQRCWWWWLVCQARLLD